jgi:outer membrane protein assembly factor BamD (BamD/ComL family)
LGKRTRITKQQLKHDVLLETTAKGTKFIEEHLNKVLIGLAAVVVVIAIVTMVTRSQRATEAAAAAALADASQALNAGFLAQAQVQYESLIDLYPGTRGARAATCYLGSIAFNQQDYNQALAHFNTYLDRHAGDRTLDRLALEGKASVLEQQRAFADAAAIYQDIAAHAADEPVAAARYLNAAIRNLRVAGAWESVASVSQDIIDIYPDTPWADEARMTLAEAQSHL